MILTPNLKSLSTRGRLNLLLDTHILMWSLTHVSRLPAACREALVSPENEVWVSSISVWEIRIKAKLGKADAHEGLRSAIISQDMKVLPFTLDHADAVSHIPLYHRDPFDRALLAQAMTEKLRFVTADREIQRYAGLVDLMMVI